MLNTKIISLTLLLLLGFIWGTGYSIARFATTNGVPPLGYSFWQSIGPALLIGLFSCTDKSKVKITVSHLKYYFICGITGIVIPNTNMYFAAPHLPAGILAAIVNTVPVVAYPIALIARVESFNLVRFIGVICAVIGLMLVILHSASLPSPAMIPWVLSTLITPASFALCAIYIARYRPETGDSLSLAAGMLIASSLLLAPVVFASGNFYTLHYPFTTPDLVILLEVVLSSVSYVILFQLIKIGGPVYYSLVDTVVTITGLAWGYFIFHEKLNAWTFPAVLFILLALFLVTKRQPVIINNRDQGDK